MSNMMAIEVSVLRDRLKGFEGSINERLLFAMKEARKGVTGLAMLSDDEKFQVSVAAVVMTVEDEEKKRLEWEVKCIRAMSTCFSGIPVDMGAVMEEGTSQGWKSIGLIGLWREVAKEGKPT